MGKCIDLTGQKFGRLTVIERTEQPEHIKAKTTRAYWICQCECGNISRPISTNALKSGRTTSCGCWNREKGEKQVHNLLGMKFGRLTVIERAGIDKNHKALWLCICECGNTHICRGSDLKSNKITSCGCWNDEQIKKTVKRLWADEEYRKKMSDSTKKQWADEEYRKKMSDKAGNKNPAWKGGITPILRHLRELHSYWYEECKQKANYTCQLTGKTNIKLNTHHLKAFSTIVLEAHQLNNIEVKQQVKDYTQKELKLLEEYVESWHRDNSNAVVLSENVHMLFHKLYGKGNNTPEQYIEFKERYLAGEFKEILK